MATILDRRTVGNHEIIVVDSNPASGAGTPAEPSSIALLGGGSSTGKFYIKSGSLDTDWIEFATNGSFVNPGVAGRIAIYQDGSGPTAGVQVDDQYLQNSQAIEVSVVAQGSRTTPIQYIVPNPGNAITTANFVLSEGDQTISGVKTFSDNLVVNGNLDINGTLTTIDTVNLQVTDKLVTLNRNGVAASATDSGLELEEGGSITGFLKTNATRNGWLVKAPAGNGILDLRLSGLTATRVHTAQDFDGLMTLQAAAGVAAQVPYFNATGQLTSEVGTGTNSFTWDATNNRLGISTASPARTLDVGGSSIFRGDLRVEDANGVNFEIRQASTTTSTSATSAIQTLATTADTVMLVETRVVARRTAGSAGATNDSSTYIRTVRVKNNGGTVTIHSVDSMYTSEDQTGWNVTFSPAGSNLEVRVTGATNNTITWHATTKIQVSV